MAKDDAQDLLLNVGGGQPLREHPCPVRSWEAIDVRPHVVCRIGARGQSAVVRYTISHNFFGMQNAGGLQWGSPKPGGVWSERCLPFRCLFGGVGAQTIWVGYLACSRESTLLHTIATGKTKKKNTKKVNETPHLQALFLTLI